VRFFFALFLFATTLTAAQVVGLSGSWKFHIGDKSAWSSPKFDDTDWESIIAPSPWEDEGFNGYDGLAWYRKKFDGRELDKDENYYLNLGYIDDADEVYVNGILIGFSGSMPPKFKTAYNTERKYSLSSDVINFNGENTIAIRVFDVTLGGGIVDGKLGIYRKPKSKMLVELNGLWSFTKSQDRQPIKDDQVWKKIMVPSAWEYQGHPHYDGYAWYKRTFTLDEKVIGSEEELVLILGKIDDFDKTYLNGKLVGKTYDGERFGESQSYAHLRAYTIPVILLKKNGINTIEILVEDMGNIGGIYEGPVGIATKTAYERYFR
jgi:Glycosyl hydrolases family 2, sugar binding domain/Beta-galactosidase jelly roll domain